MYLKSFGFQLQPVSLGVGVVGIWLPRLQPPVVKSVTFTYSLDNVQHVF